MNFFQFDSQGRIIVPENVRRDIENERKQKEQEKNESKTI